MQKDFKNWQLKIILCSLSLALLFGVHHASAATISAPPNFLKLSAGLVGWWTFDGKDMRNNVADSSGSGNNGSLIGQTATTTVVGKLGQALSFDGVNDYVSVPDAASLRPTTITVSMWVNSQDDDAIVYLLTKDKSSDFSYFFKNNDSGYLKFCTTGSTCAAGVNTSMRKKWAHVVGIYDGTNAYLYINGVLVNQGAANAIDYTSPAKLYIGYSANFPKALMDDVRIYNRVLSTSTIQQLYNLGGAKLATSPTNALTRGLVGYWTFDGADMRNNVADRSGQGNNGSLIGQTATTTAAGRIGQALSFDGSNDYVTVANESNFDFDRTNSFSASAWVNYTSDTLGKRIITKMLNGGNFQGYDFYIDSTNYVLNVQFNDSAGSSFRVWSSASSLIPGQWYYVAFTYDGSSSIAGLRLYINGVDVRDAVVGSTISSSLLNDTALIIGDNPASGGAEFLGKMDDVRVYNRALSTSTIQQLYNLGGAKLAASPTQSLTSGLVGYWTFDGADMRNNVADKSGRGNNGYLTGFTATTTAAGRVGQALNFDGSNDRVRVYDSTSLTLTNKSVAFWVKVNAQKDYNHIVNFSGCSGNTGYIMITSDGWFIVSYDNGVGAANYYNAIGATGASISGVWQHFVVTYYTTGTNNTFKLYRNGSWYGTNSSQTDGMTARCMNWISDVDWSLNGSLDDLRVYNRVLSDSEITQLYNMGR